MNEKARGGLSISAVVTIVFIILKLCKVITWSWIWVFSPIWIEAIISLVVLAIITIIGYFIKRK